MSTTRFYALRVQSCRRGGWWQVGSWVYENRDPGGDGVYSRMEPSRVPEIQPSRDVAVALCGHLNKLLAPIVFEVVALTEVKG